jgi:hypothetical protein
MGKLIEGLVECIDQYESEINGLRTSAPRRRCTISARSFACGAKTPAEGVALNDNYDPATDVMDGEM